ncbi:J domain-containing protein [Variovorax boronicumulans]|uniref:J domain-containing protein n=1 Tax=Variovorax boronicumulans TaxID=436515 RepID=UPI001C597CE1
MHTAFPLTWPLHKPRTAHWKIERSGFDRRRSFATVRDELVREIERLGGKSLIISTNIPLRQDGLPYATYSRIRDFGVAIYFKREGKDMAFACDRWDRIEDNMHAITKTIDALRGVARWGTGDMMQAAFTGFTALPPPIVAGMSRTWWDVLGLGQGAGRAEIDAAYKRLASQHHPDKGGSTAAMTEINQARDEALRAA